MSNLSKFDLSAARFAPPLQIKLDAGSQGEGAVSGYASTFDGPPDSHGDIIAPGAFGRSLREHQAAGSAPIMLWAHNQAEPIGSWTELREDAHGLFVRGKLNLETTRGRDAHAHIKAGDVNGLSIGFIVAPDGRKRGDRGATILTDIDLMEVSVVALPANRRARLNSKAEVVELLRKSGLSKEAAYRLASGGWPALTGDPDPDLTEAKQRAAAAVAELQGMLNQHLNELKGLSR